VCCQLLNGSVRGGSERRQGTDIVNNYLLDLLRDRTEVFTFGQIRNYDFFSSRSTKNNSTCARFVVSVIDSVCCALVVFAIPITHISRVGVLIICNCPC